MHHRLGRRLLAVSLRGNHLRVHASCVHPPSCGHRASRRTQRPQERVQLREGPSLLTTTFRLAKLAELVVIPCSVITVTASLLRLTAMTWSEPLPASEWVGAAPVPRQM